VDLHARRAPHAGAGARRLSHTGLHPSSLFPHARPPRPLVRPVTHPALARPVRRLFGDGPLPEPARQLVSTAGTIIADIERQRDVTNSLLEEVARELEHRLERARAGEVRYRQLFDAAPQPAFVLRRGDLVVIDWNEAAERVLGWRRGDVLDREVHALGLLTGPDCPLGARLLQPEPLPAGEPVTTRLTGRDGHPVDVAAEVCDLPTGGVPAVLVALRDLAAERTMASPVPAFLERAGIAMQRLTFEGEILEANRACRALLGHDPDALAATAFVALAAPDAVGTVRDALAELASGARATHTFEARFRHAAGTDVWIQVTLATVTAAGGRWLMAMLQDATERKRTEQQLVRQAFEDELTGLANRAVFRDRLAHALERRARHRTDVAVLLLDLDGFKRVNDSLGHAAGDALLRAIAHRITATVRAGETVARLGGDEFAIVIESVHQDEDPLALSERLLREIAAPVEIAGREVIVNVSIGIAIAQPRDDGDTVLRNADTAMYSAKASGKQCARVFDPAMHARALVWLEVEQDLRRAVALDEFELHFQPLLRLDTRALRGFEALLRWRHPIRGFVAPDEFLAVAEETGLVVPIGRWVLFEACRQAARWPAAGDHALSISVNVAPRQIEYEHFVPDVRAALADSGLDPRRLVLEITESQIMRTPELAKERLHALRELGVRIAIDDFGTGYSSLSHLQFFPVDELKIDRTFVSRVQEGDRDASFVRTMVSLARSLGVEVVAEGIEDAAQERFLALLGCHTGQGYLYSRPLTASATELYARTRGASAA
jgi:diguanylate cyclase (GGDEF)-like protein/PAS domain S-box-containing protein